MTTQDAFLAQIDAWGSLIGGIGTAGDLIAVPWQMGSAWRQRVRAETSHQAQRIAGWIAAPRPPRLDTQVIIENASTQPVYKVVAWIVLIQGAGPTTGEEAHGVLQPRTFAVIPPGRTTVSYWDEDGGGMGRRPGV